MSLHIDRVGFELPCHGLGIADKLVREVVDRVGRGEEFDVTVVPLLGVAGDEGHESRFVLAVCHDLTITFLQRTLHRV